MPQDNLHAVIWYRKAAEQGNALGQYYMGWMYENGRAVSENAVKAYMWGSLAVLNGEAHASVLRDEAAKLLTPLQLSRAYTLAEQCQASNYIICD